MRGSRAIAKAAVAAGRHPVLSGRALQRMVEAAQECGYLLDFPPTVTEQDAGYLPREKVLFICTGSQGEPLGSRLSVQIDTLIAKHEKKRAREENER